MKKIKSTKLYAWTRGIREFRQIETTSFYKSQAIAYDNGRKLAHKLTIHFFDFGLDRKWH